MTKGEHCQLKLKSKATFGVEKFNLPKNAHVEYIVTLHAFEKVRWADRSDRSAPAHTS